MDLVHGWLLGAVWLSPESTFPACVLSQRQQLEKVSAGWNLYRTASLASRLQQKIWSFTKTNKKTQQTNKQVRMNRVHKQSVSP